MVEVGAEVVSFTDPLQIGDVHSIGLYDRSEPIIAAEGLVAFERDVPSIAPPGRQGELPLGLERTPPALVPQVGRLFILDRGEIHAVLTGGQTVPELTLPEHAPV